MLRKFRSLCKCLGCGARFKEPFYGEAGINQFVDIAFNGPVVFYYTINKPPGNTLGLLFIIINRPMGFRRIFQVIPPFQQ